MSELTIDISETTHKTLLQLAQTSGEDFATIMDRAVENYRRYVFLIQADRAFVTRLQIGFLFCRLVLMDTRKYSWHKYFRQHLKRSIA
jgi:hypothetical protein